MAGCIDSLVVGRVIGDVLNMFVPTVSMSVRYGTKDVSNGCEVKPSVAAEPPTVNISGHPHNLYTLLMADPDAPSPSHPTMREWAHWIVVDMPGATDPLQARELLAYMGPRPPVGVHRYVFVLFQQKGRFPPVSPPATRANFNTRDFAAQFDLGLPVAAAYFNAQNEPASHDTKHRGT